MLRVEVSGRARVGKTTLISHIAHCLRKAGYDVTVEPGPDPGELEDLPPYFQRGQKIILVEVDTTPRSTKKSGDFWYFAVVICVVGGVLSVMTLPLTMAITVTAVMSIVILTLGLISGRD